MTSFRYVAEACNLKNNYINAIEGIDVKEKYSELTLDVALEIIKNKTMNQKILKICKDYVKLWKDMKNG